MKYIRLFPKLSDYNSSESTLIRPNTSFVRKEKKFLTKPKRNKPTVVIPDFRVQNEILYISSGGGTYNNGVLTLKRGQVINNVLIL